MDYLDWDITEGKAVAGRVSRAYRRIWHGRAQRRRELNGYRRRLRRATRQAVIKGDSRDMPGMLTYRDIL